jgi:SAM-dependent methyltransferase
MTVFADYARYYNLLYQDKDYAGETEFILSCLKKCGAAPRTILDLGCGTGRHGFEMARRGIAVTGVDMSETMLSMGNAFLKKAPAEPGMPLPVLHQGDARTVRLDRKFDAVVSLFHVMSYQTTEADALAELQTAGEHLSPGGVFLFDFWYGPGVLTDPPTEREKVMEDEAVHMLRHAGPVHRVNDNIVEVHYRITITDKKTGHTSRIIEMHPMRYWFMPELRHLADSAGFSVLAEGAWLAEAPPEKTTWNAWMCLQKRPGA